MGYIEVHFSINYNEDNDAEIRAMFRRDTVSAVRVYDCMTDFTDYFRQHMDEFRNHANIIDLTLKQAKE